MLKGLSDLSGVSMDVGSGDIGGWKTSFKKFSSLIIHILDILDLFSRVSNGSVLKIYIVGGWFEVCQFGEWSELGALATTVQSWLLTLVRDCLWLPRYLLGIPSLRVVVIGEWCIAPNISFILRECKASARSWLIFQHLQGFYRILTEGLAYVLLGQHAH